MPFNIPILLTWLRVALIPLVVGVFYLPPDWLTEYERGLSATIIFVVAALTDWFDGYLARRWKQQSSLGRMLDPIADKVLVAVVLLVLCADGILQGGHIWAAIIILSREVLVSGLREYLGELQVSVPVTRIAKWKTAVQMIAIGFLIAGPAGDTVIPHTTTAGIAMLWIAAALTLYTGYDYFRAGIRHVVD